MRLNLSFWAKIKSPSSRRAWIEINVAAVTRSDAARVALLAEGVDRNVWMFAGLWQSTSSPSSRRAWIEITAATQRTIWSFVALLAEGVDRNPLP